ncbi:hypothetical protein [Bradyrhizobium sp. SZCCHNRI2007]|uniref:hypothetical protein n=1 Tax=Bradyrhizobium sp. SZCCHNRI2007 TaxID=3057281 RepID=UPI0028ED501A|nr:hypothetical protein [Bradyrhizobium sp. SZCCHNRI2007]
MADAFDLFGDPIPANRGKRGRPQHVPTTENRNRVIVLLAMGWSNERIAGAMRITEPTLKKHYFSELRDRDIQRDRLNAALLMEGYKGVQNGGGASAIRMFVQLVERNDLMTYGQSLKPQAAKPKAVKAEKIGKKAAEIAAAQHPDAGTAMGELMARRQQSMN